MDPLFLVIAVFCLLLIGLDYVVKRRRLNLRQDMDDEDFLGFFQGTLRRKRSTDILAAREMIAKQLGLPVRKIRPSDSLLELRDELCFVVSGHMALGELLEDLESEIEPQIHEEEIETVGQYIEVYISPGP